MHLSFSFLDVESRLKNIDKDIKSIPNNVNHAVEVGGRKIASLINGMFTFYPVNQFTTPVC